MKSGVLCVEKVHERTHTASSFVSPSIELHINSSTEVYISAKLPFTLIIWHFQYIAFAIKSNLWETLCFKLQFYFCFYFGHTLILSADILTHSRLNKVHTKKKCDRKFKRTEMNCFKLAGSVTNLYNASSHPHTSITQYNNIFLNV